MTCGTSAIQVVLAWLSVMIVCRRKVKIFRGMVDIRVRAPITAFSFVSFDILLYVSRSDGFSKLGKCQSPVLSPVIAFQNFLMFFLSLVIVVDDCFCAGWCRNTMTREGDLNQGPRGFLCPLHNGRSSAAASICSWKHWRTKCEA
jgi:hypothetical protein